MQRRLTGDPRLVDVDVEPIRGEQVEVRFLVAYQLHHGVASLRGPAQEILEEVGDDPAHLGLGPPPEVVPLPGVLQPLELVVDHLGHPAEPATEVVVEGRGEFSPEVTQHHLPPRCRALEVF